MYKKILVPLDGTPQAEEALPYAEALARSDDAELIILRIPDAPAPEFLAGDPGLAHKILNEAGVEAQRYVNKTLNTLVTEHVKVSGITRIGPVPDTIIAVAEETHADMIAMYTHGYTGIKRWLMGSVADEVIRHTHIPVMLIHPN